MPYDPQVSDPQRDPYSPASPDAAWLPDAVGPDGVRVTLRVEPRVDRLRRLRFMLSTPAPLTDPLGTYFDYQTLPGLVQRYLLGDRWAVDVEADNGVRCRVKATNRDEAITYARQIQGGVQADGVAFLRTFAR